MNAFLENNLGDDLFVDILLQRYNKHQFYALSADYLPTHNLKVFSNPLGIKIIRRCGLKPLLANQCDIAITIGGSMYMETNRKSKFSLGKKPYYILGTNFGPYSSKEYYQKAHAFFAGAQDVCFRERYSYELFSDLKNVRYASDIVFTLDTSQIPKTNVKKVIFSIISCERKLSIKYQKQYEEKMIEMTQFFIKKGYEVCYMSFCKKEGDEEAIASILQQCKKEIKEKITTYFYRGNRKEALKILADSQIIIGSRFHANILGMLLGKTVIPMMYSKKTKHVLEDMNFQGKVVDIKEIENFSVQELTQEELNRKQDISYQIQDAQEQFKILDKILK